MSNSTRIRIRIFVAFRRAPSFELEKEFEGVLVPYHSRFQPVPDVAYYFQPNGYSMLVQNPDGSFSSSLVYEGHGWGIEAAKQAVEYLTELGWAENLNK